MKPLFKILTVATAAFALSSMAQAGEVKVDLTGVRAGGILYVQLQTRDQFMTSARAYGELVRVRGAGPLSLTLKDVAPGDYALTVWHDDNENGRFDFDAATGRPADGWAAPNGDTIRAAPIFDEVKSSVGATPVTISLPVRYGR